jgi:H/ACA ribonucleoprotein complex subunit 3
MTESILRICRGCHQYTLRATCPACGAETRTPHPARYNPNDRWGRYRRLLTEATSRGPAE